MKSTSHRLGWVKANFWRVVLAFLLARFATRVSGILFARLGEVVVVAGLALALQGLYFGIIYSLLVRRFYPMLCLVSAVASVAIGLPLFLIGSSGLIDPRWMLAGLPATLLAFTLSAWWLRGRRPPVSPV
ncbi:hypothetical protein ACOI1H_01275 [Loktanella sp. DJP18]|uniref:hypothetical protein n=1 Tax=Loktanella sp. DJP18 TaxID=3409788 RepID=UPI003BB5F8FE